MNNAWIAVNAAGVLVLGACSSSKPKPDAYAEAAKRKNAEIARISQQIDSLKTRADVSFLTRQIDSLETLRAVAKASLGGIGQAVQAEKSRNDLLQAKLLDYDTAAMRWDRESKDRKGH